MLRRLLLLNMIWVLCALPFSASAQATLESVFAQTAKQEKAALEYREVKHIIFLQKPVETSGRMFFVGDEFVIEQLLPSRQLITADQHRLRFYVPDRDLRHSKMIASPMVQRVRKFFKPLMLGDLQSIKMQFDTHFTVADDEWTLFLKPKDIEKSMFVQMRIDGKEGKTPHYVQVEMDDGSRSEWFFSPMLNSDKHEDIMQQLLQESKR